MQSAGEIRRVPLDGRLDRQRYKYECWNIKPEGSFTDLARRFFGWTGGAPASEFQAFSGLGVRAVRQAVEPLQLAPFGEDLLMLPEDREQFGNFESPKQPQYALIGGLDNILPPTGLQDFGEHRIVDRGRSGRIVEVR
ncbi:MAG: hypothetical protein M3N54_10550, partial [Acidobacteriota bacterium]|nr:hypothetical protein [Acidobacteriota bacterium]